MEHKDGWLARRRRDPEFVKATICEDFAEEYVEYVEQEMLRLGVNRADLAKRMGCSGANITRAMKHSTNLTIRTMVEMGYALNFRVRPYFEALEVCATKSKARHLHVVRDQELAPSPWCDSLVEEAA